MAAIPAEVRLTWYREAEALIVRRLAKFKAKQEST